MFRRYILRYVVVLLAMSSMSVGQVEARNRWQQHTFLFVGESQTLYLGGYSRKGAVCRRVRDLVAWHRGKPSDCLLAWSKLPVQYTYNWRAPLVKEGPARYLFVLRIRGFGAYDITDRSQTTTVVTPGENVTLRDAGAFASPTSDQIVMHAQHTCYVRVLRQLPPPSRRPFKVVLGCTDSGAAVGWVEPKLYAVLHHRGTRYEALITRPLIVLSRDEQQLLHQVE